MLIVRKFMVLHNHGFQCNFLHGLLDCIFNFMVRSLQDFSNILRHGTGTTLAGVNPNDGGYAIRFQCGIDLIQGDLGGIVAQFRTTGSAGHGDQTGLFQCT